MMVRLLSFTRFDHDGRGLKREGNVSSILKNRTSTNGLIMVFDFRKEQAAQRTFFSTFKSSVRGCIGVTADFQSYHYYSIFDKTSALAKYDGTLDNEVDYFNYSTIFGKEDRCFGNPQGLVKSGGLTSLTSDLDLYEFFTIFGKCEEQYSTDYNFYDFYSIFENHKTKKHQKTQNSYKNNKLEENYYDFFTISENEKQPYSTDYNFYDFYSIFENQNTKKNQKVQNSYKSYKTENCCYSLTSDFNGFNFYNLFKDCAQSASGFELYDFFKFFEEKVPVSGSKVYEFYTGSQKKSGYSLEKLKSEFVYLPKSNFSSKVFLSIWESSSFPKSVRLANGEIVTETLGKALLPKCQSVSLPTLNSLPSLQKVPKDYGYTYIFKLGAVLANRSLSSLHRLDVHLRNSCSVYLPDNVSTFNFQPKPEMVSMQTYWKSSKRTQYSLELVSTSKEMFLALKESTISEMVWEYFSDDDMSIASLSPSILEASDYGKDVCEKFSSSCSSLMALSPLIPETDLSLVEQREAIRQILDSKPKLMILPAPDGDLEGKAVDKQHLSPFRKVFSKLKPRKLFALFASIRHSKR
ncbi:hypothetical protein CANTEDRAFT_136711 [Yamadazyma tenuis ATCC 10573]|uniref:Uncharacterized protein n=1 Tax=Candida tenuis (strain ATCC 10573 / BCRC 21748 / CBS 615 / JCM 9827 / NBRC 10315 / NRRL Y-1498 / VKM Y-70) TaxID=590646 RepID=G3BCW1_CANTC|nr:uncharacterized protein CANTEDRAFT_136711 [Yamadazyma tenuis ATCC 10573]EGV60222.1 hypothetical protein CANTEDRAFT_136711 [Yamadazyma tenuis ATCC 10573]